jgi:hypothetical protein
MPYIENGRVVQRRTALRFGTISDLFWGILNGIYALYVNCVFFELSLSG